MNDDWVLQALALWGMDSARVTLAAARENTVYRIDFEGASFALRLHRRGYRRGDELISELEWMDALAKGELRLPRPVKALDGKFCHFVDGTGVDVLTWLSGKPMGKNGDAAPLQNPTAAYRALGHSMARLHLISDEWRPPADFSRPSWDIDGLLGGEPLWGRFWENPTLSRPQVQKFLELKSFAQDTLERLEDTLDQGLIHADLVPENVLIDCARIQLIDFDDGGFGFRLFDIATTLNRARRTNAYEKCKEAFLDGYLSTRGIDLELLPLFQVLRALTYVGWIVPRMEEQGATIRNERFVSEAMFWADQLSFGE